MDSEQLYVVTSVRPKTISTDQLLTLPDTDDQGRVLFRAPLSVEKFRGTLATYVNAAQAALASVKQIADGYVVDEIKLTLGIDATAGCVFLGEGKVEASVEVTIKRK